jgi:hypothetical protein
MSKHYSEEIIEILINEFGWTATQTGIARGYTAEDKSGTFNPQGIFIMTASFCDRSRYFSLYSGFNVVFDIDCRDAEPSKAAERFNRAFEEYIKTA